MLIALCRAFCCCHDPPWLAGIGLNVQTPGLATGCLQFSAPAVKALGRGGAQPRSNPRLKLRGAEEVTKRLQTALLVISIKISIHMNIGMSASVLVYCIKA
jgi:hypothetical protein